MFLPSPRRRPLANPGPLTDAPSRPLARAAQSSTSAAPDPRLWPGHLSAVEHLQLRRAPLLFAALCLCLGELLATRAWHPPILMLLALIALLVLATVALRQATRTPRSRSAHRLATLPVATLWLLLGILAAHLTPSPDPEAQLRPYADNLSRSIVGRVTRTRLLPPLPAASTTADAEHTWQTAEPEDAAPAAEQVDLQLSRIEDLTPDTSRLVPISGGIRLTLYTAPGSTSSALPSLPCGALIQVPARLRLPEHFRDPGAWQYADYLLAQGIGAHGSAHAEKLQLLSPATAAAALLTRSVAANATAAASVPDRRAALNCRILAAQTWASTRLARFAQSHANRSLPALLRLAPQDTGMLNAMLFGDRAGLNHQLRLGFERTGSFHLFVVSGMHVALVAGLLLWLLRRLRFRGRRIVSDAAATLLTLPLLTAYALITGFGAPVQRALAMTAVFLLARLLSRQRSVLNALGAAALFALLWSPHALFEASFQMTVLAIVAIAGIAIPLGEQTFLPYAAAVRNLDELRLDQALPPRLAQLRVTLRLWSGSLTTLAGPLAARALVATLRLAAATLELVLIGLVAELVMALPMAVYFHRATLFALPANMASIPVVGLLVPAAVLTFIATLLSPWLALLPSAITALLLHAVTFAIGHISRVPLADARVPPPSPWVIVLALLAWSFCCWAVRRSRPFALAAAIILPLTTLAILWPEPALRTSGRLELTAIDVGQGDSLLLVGAEGRTMLIDAGGPTGSVLEAATATSLFDVGEEVVAPYLWSRRIRRLDTVVLTHAHSDHMGGMPAILRDLRPRELWISVPAHAQAFTDLLAEAAQLGITVRSLHAGDALPWGDEHIDVLSPEPAYTNPGTPKNDDSLVLRVRYGQSSLQLEGDAEAPSERAMLASGRLAPVTLLKVGHHGSLTSTTPDFLNALHPRQAVLSAGLGNHFGHPRPEILLRLAGANVRLARTDQFGLTTYLLDRDGHVTAAFASSE